MVEAIVTREDGAQISDGRLRFVCETIDLLFFSFPSSCASAHGNFDLNSNCWYQFLLIFAILLYEYLELISSRSIIAFFLKLPRINLQCFLFREPFQAALLCSVWFLVLTHVFLLAFLYSRLNSSAFAIEHSLSSLVANFASAHPFLVCTLLTMRSLVPNL